MLRRNVPALLSFGVILALACAAIFAPFLARYHPNAVVPEASFQPPSLAHPFGTDLFGRDLLTRVTDGTRLSLLVGIVAVAIGALGGALLGMLAAVGRGHVEQIIMRTMDVVLAFPFILLAILILAFFGPGLINVMLAVGIAYVPRFARLTHASTPLPPCSQGSSSC